MLFILERTKSDMLDHFNVIIDTITGNVTFVSLSLLFWLEIINSNFISALQGLLNPFYDIAYPTAVILVLISVIIFAWRATEGNVWLLSRLWIL